MDDIFTGEEPQKPSIIPAGEPVVLWGPGPLPLEVKLQNVPEPNALETDITPWEQSKRREVTEYIHYIPSERPADRIAPLVLKTTVRVVKVVSPVMVGGAVLYGLFLALSWLVAQTIFWIIVLGGGTAYVLLCLFIEARMDSRPPERRDNPGGNVTTNVHVNNAKGDVTTNVFVNYKNDET